MRFLNTVKATGLGVALLVGGAVSATAAVVYDVAVSHDTQVVDAAVELGGRLGTAVTVYNGNDPTSRGSEIGGLSSGDVLFLGQSDATVGNTTPSENAAIKSFVQGGGVLIKLWGDDFSLLNFVADEAFVYSYGGIPTSIAATAATTGTTFDALVDPLPGLNDHGGILLTSVGGATTMYENGSLAHILVKEVGAGHVAFLSWDWCCGESEMTLGQWNDALFAAATFSGGGVAPVPLPAGLPLLGIGLVALGLTRRRKAD